MDEDFQILDTEGQVMEDQSEGMKVKAAESEASLQEEINQRSLLEEARATVLPADSSIGISEKGGPVIEVSTLRDGAVEETQYML